MSKNFELMQRAGKLLEIELPPPREPAAAPRRPPIAPAHAEALAPPFVPVPERAYARSEKWQPARPENGLDVDQIAREESHRLVQQIFLLQTQEPARVVVFAGIDHGNGCTTICARVGEALQDTVRASICLVEANFRTPSLRRRYGGANHHGLTDALVGEGPVRSFARPVRRDSLYLMSCGARAANLRHLLNTERLRSRFRELRNEFDFVVVDAPPLTRYSDAIALGKAADGLVLVLEANSTRREAAVRVSEHLRASQIRILGAILNKRTFPIPDVLYRHL